MPGQAPINSLQPAQWQALPERSVPYLKASRACVSASVFCCFCLDLGILILELGILFPVCFVIFTVLLPRA